MIKPEDYTAKVISIRQASQKIKIIELECDRDFNYLPGQFVNLKFEDPFGKQGQMQRAYSIASKPNGKCFELCIEIIENGCGTTYIDSWVVGEKIQIKAPFGHCTLNEDNQEELILIATGTGIAPIKSILETLAAQKDTRRIDFFFGLRYEEDLIYQAEIEALAKELPNLNYKLTLSKPSENWTGLKGRVTSHLKNFDMSHLPDLFICGSLAMAKDVMQIAKEKGIERKKIHLEAYG